MAYKVFNWSLLDRSALYSMMNQLRSKVVGKRLNVDKFHGILAKHLKKHLPIRIVKDRDPKTESTYVYVGGFYYGEYDEKMHKGKNKPQPIEIVFSYHLFDEFIELGRHKWERICILFADTLLHEIIHMRQQRSRNFKNIPGYQSTAQYAKERREQEYYGDRDEIGAYAFNIACELYDRFGTDFAAAKRYLDSETYRRHKRTCFYRYMKVFDHNHDHKIIRRIKLKAIHNLPYAVLGNPFKTSDQLTY